MDDGPDLTTVVVSALASAGVAAVVSLLVAVLLGGTLEVRKRRAVRREQVREELLRITRIQYNDVRLLQQSQFGWTTLDGKITEFTDDVDQGISDLEMEYQAARTHIAATDAEPEDTVGWALMSAGTHLGRIRHFRGQAVGNEPDALTAATDAMRQDLATAAVLLNLAQRFLQAGWIRRRWRRRSLRRRLQEIEVLGARGDAPQTPLNYYVALERLRGGQATEPKAPG